MSIPEFGDRKFETFPVYEFRTGNRSICMLLEKYAAQTWHSMMAQLEAIHIFPCGAEHEEHQFFNGDCYNRQLNAACFHPEGEYNAKTQGAVPLIRDAAELPVMLGYPVVDTQYRYYVDDTERRSHVVRSQPPFFFREEGKKGESPFMDSLFKIVNEGSQVDAIPRNRYLDLDAQGIARNNDPLRIIARSQTKMENIIFGGKVMKLRDILLTGYHRVLETQQRKPKKPRYERKRR